MIATLWSRSAFRFHEMWAADGVTERVPGVESTRRLLARMDRYGFLWRVFGTTPPTWHLTQRRAQIDYNRRLDLGLAQWKQDHGNVGGV